MRTPVIVLAAGTSRRMGRPKPLLEFDGETCLSLVLAACRHSLAREVVLVLGEAGGEIHAAASRLDAGRLPPGVTIAINERPERGQTSTVKVGLETLTADSDGFVLLPIDHPLVTAADIDALVTRFESKPRGRSIFIAAHENRRGHPALFASSHRNGILELGDDEPLHDYLRLREAVTEQVPVDNPGVVSDMDTPEQYQALLGLYRARAGHAGRPL